MALHLNLKLRLLHQDEVAMGPGKADLLEAIAASGSISAAARNMGMSYRRAWLLVEVMNRSFREPVVMRAVGGAHGGGAQLTDTGRAALAAFREMEAAALAAADAHGAVLEGLLK